MSDEAFGSPGSLKFAPLIVMRRGLEEAGNAAGTIKFDMPSNYASELRTRYVAEDGVVRILASKTCSEAAQGPLYAAYAPGLIEVNKLTAFVSAPGSRVAARLVDRGAKVLATATCERAPSEIIAYTAHCEFQLDGIRRSEVARLQITVVGGDAMTTIVSNDVRLTE